MIWEPFLRALMQRNPQVDWQQLDDVIYGNANQAGEDNRNVARMSALLAGLPCDVPGNTVNRLCGSGIDAIGIAARAIKSGETDLLIAGGCESMSRAPFVMGKAETAFSREPNGLQDTTIGWRFINPKMQAEFGVDSMPETAENVAEAYNISREDQDLFALRSQQKPLRHWKPAALSGKSCRWKFPGEKGIRWLSVRMNIHARIPGWKIWPSFVPPSVRVAVSQPATHPASTTVLLPC